MKLPVRKIYVDITLLLLCLLILSSLSLILFTRYENSRIVSALAKSTIVAASQRILDKVDSITKQAELIVNLTKGDLVGPGTVQERLIPYLTNVITVVPYLSSIQVTQSNGDFVAIYNARVNQVSQYFFHQYKQVPEETKYIINVMHRASHNPAVEEVRYLNNDMQIIDVERKVSNDFDPRSEAWYMQAVKWPALHWIPVFYNMWHLQVVGVSLPVRDYSGSVFAVIKINISLKELSNFVALQTIGHSGKTFILQNNGSILLPQGDVDATLRSLLTSGYEKFMEGHRNLLLLDSEQGQYFVNFAELPIAYDDIWLVAVLVKYNDFFADVIKAEHKALLISFMLVILFSGAAFIVATHISRPIVRLARNVDLITNLDFSEQQPVSSRIIEIMTLTNSVKAMRRALFAFSRFIPIEVVRALIAQGRELVLGGERREMTILFTDIANFTTHSESMIIEDLVHALSAQLSEISKAVLHYEGTLDKYIGDSVMAFWGAPTAIVDSSIKACYAALTAHRQLQKTQEWQSRFGIHVGEVLVGNLGTEERMNYTAIGNPVNVAARLQALNKQYATCILISESVLEKIGTHFVTRPIDCVALKGKMNKITIYELLGTKDEVTLQASMEDIELANAFTHCYSLLQAGQVVAAKAAFISLAAQFPQDIPTKIYLERLGLKEKG